MKIINLNDDDLQIFLESLPEEFVRNLFNNLKSLHDSLKGFRIKSAPMKQLIKIVMSSLKDDHDSKVEKVIESFYEDYKKTIKEEVSKYISSGYSEKEANALAIEDGLTERELLHAQIIRDADKTDNFRVKAEDDFENIVDNSSKEILEHDIISKNRVQLHTQL